MKKILIISPHFPPSNLAAVHRSRLFAQHLPTYAWQPTILTVHEKYYEEKPDWNLVKLLPPNLRIEKVNALPVTHPRLIGDIGLRGFFQLFNRARSVIKNEKMDFLFIPVPSFYCALLGRWLHAATGIPYGIDYIDPWVHHFPGSDKIFSRHWLSTKIAALLEPVAVKKVSMITGVAAGYYKGVIERNPKLTPHVLFDAMPYGGEKTDHEKIKMLTLSPALFTKKSNKIQLLYAGAFLPRAYLVLDQMFGAIQRDQQLFTDVEFHFIGTGKKTDDPLSFSIKPLAAQYGLWQTIVFEYPQRIPYLDVLVHLNNVDAVFILGSTEPHYTPSKIYQAILSEKPVLAILHQQSSGTQVIENANAGLVLAFNGIEDIETVGKKFTQVWKKFEAYIKSFHPIEINMEVFEKYSASAVTKQLAAMLNKIVP